MIARLAPLLAIAVGTALAACPVAVAAPDDVALNGTFIAVSDGALAKTNEIFRDQATVTSAWTISTSCVTFQDCTGTVTSDQGWTADLVYLSQRWRATRVVDNWLHCPDGTTAPGTQSFTFWSARLDAGDRHDRLNGWDETVGPSGACGVNRWVTVRMPLALERSRSG